MEKTDYGPENLLKQWRKVWTDSSPRKIFRASQSMALKNQEIPGHILTELEQTMVGVQTSCMNAESWSPYV